MAVLETIDLHLVQVPLKRPYKLAFGDVLALDSIVVEVRTDDGGHGLGEATMLPAYGGERTEDAWTFCAARTGDIPGTDTGSAKRMLDTFLHDFPFSVSAMTAALEMAEGHPALVRDRAVRVPVLGAIASNDLADIPDEIDKLLAAGYGTIKVKVGFDLEKDIARVRFIQDYMAGRALIRLDGNQGFDAEQGCRFASSLEPAGIELFEQPCPAHDWDAATRVAAVSTVPMMMDESIFGVDDIDRAADLGIAAYVKLKLLKMGGIGSLAAGLDRIRERGMKPVLGNGVANDIACWQEAAVAAARIDNAGEFNGFQRPVSGLLAEPLPFDGDCIALDPAYVPRLDADKLRHYGLKHVRHDKKSAAASAD